MDGFAGFQQTTRLSNIIEKRVGLHIEACVPYAHNTAVVRNLFVKEYQ